MPTPDLAPPGHEGSQDWSDRRADARRNHERIITAAVEVFAECGLEATMPQIAARAGVGKATVYRSYPTKAELVAAVAQHHISWLESRVAAAVKEPDAYAALNRFIGDMFDRLANDRVLGDLLPQASSTAPNLVGLMDDLLTRAKAQDRVRADATEEDLRILIGGCARQLARMNNHDPARWRRFSELVINALRP